MPPSVEDSAKSLVLSVSKLLCSTITCYNVQNLNCGIIIKPMILIGLAMRLAEFAV